MSDMKERDHLEYIGLDKRITLKWILKIKMGGQGPNSCGLGQEQVAASCEHVNERFKKLFTLCILNHYFNLIYQLNDTTVITLLQHVLP